MKYIFSGLLWFIPQIAFGFGLVGFSGPNADNATYENRILWSEDVTQTAWYKYSFDASGVTDNGDHSQTVTQNIDPTNTNLMRQLETSGICMTDSANYVLRLQMTSIQTDSRAQVKVFGSVDSLPTEYAVYNSAGYYTKVTLPFTDNPAGQTYPHFYALNAVGDYAESDTIRIRDIQIAADPGPAAYFTGDSICEYSQYFLDDGVTLSQDTGITYSKEFAYDKRISFLRNCQPGAVLSQIYGYMQDDLSPERYPVVVIEGGMNDINTAGTGTVAAMKLTYADMVTLAKNNSDHVVLICVPPYQGTETRHGYWVEFNAWIESTYGSDPDITVYHPADDIGDVDGNPVVPTYYTSSGNLHPNQLAHRIMGQSLVSLVPMPSTALTINEYTKTTSSCVLP